MFGEGSEPRVHDTRWRILAKIVGAAWTAVPNSDPADLPTPHDTRWMLIRKWNKILTGM